MIAVDLIAQAKADGLTLTVKGDRLNVKGPPDAVSRWIAPLKAAKPEVIAFLAPVAAGDAVAPACGVPRLRVLEQVAADPFEPPHSQSLGQWQRWHALLIQHKRKLGHPADLAAGLGYGEAVNEWHKANGAAPPTDRCAGCGEPIGNPGTDPWNFPDGARLHPRTDCAAVYGKAWHAAAAAALARLGIAAPAGWEP